MLSPISISFIYLIFYFLFFLILQWQTRIIQTFLNLHFSSYAECILEKITQNPGNVVTFLRKELWPSPQFELFILPKIWDFYVALFQRKVLYPFSYCFCWWRISHVTQKMTIKMLFKLSGIFCSLKSLYVQQFSGVLKYRSVFQKTTKLENFENVTKLLFYQKQLMGKLVVLEC